MNITQILIKPILTEKSYSLNRGDIKQYVFLVNPKANKHEIFNAFVALYNFSPLKINTHIKKSVRVGMGTFHPGYSKLEKIAYITLPPGKDINVDNDTKNADNTKLQKPADDLNTKGVLKEITSSNQNSKKSASTSSSKKDLSSIKEVKKNNDIKSDKSIAKISPTKDLNEINKKEQQK